MDEQKRDRKTYGTKKGTNKQTNGQTGGTNKKGQTNIQTDRPTNKKIIIQILTLYLTVEWGWIALITFIWSLFSFKSGSWQTTRRPSRMTLGSLERYTISKSIFIKAKRRKLPPVWESSMLGISRLVSRAWKTKMKKEELLDLIYFPLNFRS